MNKKNILALANIIEKQPHAVYPAHSGFNMRQYNHECGSPSCIAGWAQNMSDGTFDPHEDAAEFLGINERTSENLFETNLLLSEMTDITPAQAAFCLRHLAETGKVDWNLAIRKGAR